MLSAIIHNAILKGADTLVDRIDLTLFQRFGWIFEPTPMTWGKRCGPLDHRSIHGFLARWCDQRQWRRPEFLTCELVVIDVIAWLTLISVDVYKCFISSIEMPYSRGSFDRPSVMSKSSVETSKYERGDCWQMTRRWRSQSTERSRYSWIKHVECCLFPLNAPKSCHWKLVPVHIHYRTRIERIRAHVMCCRCQICSWQCFYRCSTPTVTRFHYFVTHFRKIKLNTNSSSQLI